MKNITLAITMLMLLSSPLVFAETGTSTSTTVNVTTTPATVPDSNANTAATSSTTTTSTTTVTSSDTNIIAAVYDAYAKDAALIGTNLTVGSQNGIVSISGTVTSQSQADEAVIAAKSVPGVKDVKSSIHVTTNPSFNKTVTVPNY